MKCEECVHGKRITSRRVNCILYGMILLREHECSREGAEKRAGVDGDGQDIREDAELSEFGGRPAEIMPGIL